MNTVFINDIHSPAPFVSFPLVLDGMKVDVAKVQNHHAWDHTDGDEIKLLWVALSHTQCMLSEDDWIGCKHVIGCLEVRGGASEPPVAVTSARQRSGALWSPSPTSTSCPFICDHVSPAATRPAGGDRFHLSSVSGSQYPELSLSRSPCPAAGLPELISQMKRLLFCSVMYLCGRGKETRRPHDQIHLLLEHASGVKGIGHPKIKILGLFYSPSSHFKPVWLTFLGREDSLFAIAVNG